MYSAGLVPIESRFARLIAANRAACRFSMKIAWSPKSGIPKPGNRFSEKIMLEEKRRA
jgi:hypothetical protein